MGGLIGQLLGRFFRKYRWHGVIVTTCTIIALIATCNTFTGSPGNPDVDLTIENIQCGRIDDHAEYTVAVIVRYASGDPDSILITPRVEFDQAGPSTEWKNIGSAFWIDKGESIDIKAATFNLNSAQYKKCKIKFLVRASWDDNGWDVKPSKSSSAVQTVYR